jgi:hypothetical protein
MIFPVGGDDIALELPGSIRLRRNYNAANPICVPQQNPARVECGAGANQ